MQRIEIVSTEIKSKSGDSERTGKPWTIRWQDAVLHDTRKKYPASCQVNLAKGQAPYAVGTYDIEGPLSVNGFDSLQMSRDLGLVPVKSAKAA